MRGAPVEPSLVIWANYLEPLPCVRSFQRANHDAFSMVAATVEALLLDPAPQIGLETPPRLPLQTKPAISICAGRSCSARCSISSQRPCSKS